MLFRLPDLSKIVQGAYAAAGDLAEIRTLPWTDATPARPFPPGAAFAHTIDLRDFAYDPGFRGVAMIDFFLRRLGLEPEAVPPSLRRNAWLAPRVTAAAWPGLPRDYVLVCPHSSMALRAMPDEIHDEILAMLAAHGVSVMTQGTARHGARAVPPAADFEALCGLVAGARAMIATDTAMPHLADAFAVPCLALFTTHRPVWRMRDYKLCHPVHLPPALPEALEFARSPADEAAARAAWFPHGRDLLWVRQAVAALIGAPSQVAKQ